MPPSLPLPRSQVLASLRIVRSGNDSPGGSIHVSIPYVIGASIAHLCPQKAGQEALYER